MTLEFHSRIANVVQSTTQQIIAQYCPKSAFCITLELFRIYFPRRVQDPKIIGVLQVKDANVYLGNGRDAEAAQFLGNSILIILKEVKDGVD